MSGLDASYIIKQKCPETIILLNTAYAEFEFARKAVEYGLDAYLLKPAKEAQIIETIFNCCTKKQKKTATPSQYVNCVVTEHKATSNHTISMIKEYINEHFHQNLTLEELADLAHFSPSYLSRLFHSTTGLTLKTYITLKRLENAEYLLKNSSLNIHEIAFNCGFPNVSHFNRVFKAHTNLSPMEYRRHYS
jgi:YesN/AraC family two-component response regulator